MKPEKVPGSSNPSGAEERMTGVMTNKRTNTVRRSAAALGVAALTMTLVAACGGSGSTPKSDSKLDPATSVTTKLLSFTPGKLTVKVGTKVTWTDSDSIGHTVTTGMYKLGSDQLRTEEHPDGLIDMPLSGGKDVSYTFKKAGKYVYYCSIHKGMNGEIDVTP